MKKTVLSLMLALCLLLSSSIALATTFTDAHGNEIELDDSLEAYTTVVLSGADNAARKEETNLGDLWTDALRITLSRSGTAATCVPILRKANSARRSWLRFCPFRTRLPSST